MAMVKAGAHRLTYRDYKFEYKTRKVTHASGIQETSKWVDLTKTLIPEGKIAYVQCPKCRADDWTEDSQFMAGVVCGCCGYEILVHTDERLVEEIDNV